MGYLNIGSLNKGHLNLGYLNLGRLNLGHLNLRLSRLGRMKPSRVSLFLPFIAFLVLALPACAQEPAAADAPAQVRVPPPPEDATLPELESKGDELRSQKAYLDSIDYYRAALKQSDNPVLHNKIGMCLLQLRRDVEAKREFLHAIKQNKDYPEAYNNLGALYYNSRRYGAAIREYKRAIKLNDDSASFHSNLGGAYFSLKDFDRAAREYQRAIEIDPDIFQRQSASAAISIRLVGANDLGHFHYVMAQMYGQHGDEQHCRFYLSKANEEGYPTRSALRDNEFASLRKDPDFVVFLHSLKPPPSGSN
jgi:tetratricopeptide (TPR) repeat protein